MLTFELVLLTITYTSLSIALFLQLLCYKQKIENFETIAFTTSLLLLVVSMSLSPLFPNTSTTPVPTLVCMVLVAVSTFWNTLCERKTSISTIYIKIAQVIGAVLILGVFVSFLVEHLFYFQYVIVVFLIISVTTSMTIVKFTKPKKRYEHLEKSNKIFAITFLILVPVYLLFLYVFEKEYEQFQIGFLLYFAFIALAGSKIYDDMQRLSLIGKNIEPQKQQFINFGLTDREEEIASLLVKGLTYQLIADQLFISLPTVKTHASNIYKKCKVKTRNELTYKLIY